MTFLADPCDFFAPNASAQADRFAAHLPIGGVYEAAWRNDSNLRKLLRGLGEELFRVEAEIFRLCMEFDPSRTMDLISEWETSVGIPDSCFKTTASLQERRNQVLVKLRGFIVRSAADFIALAALFGEVIVIEPGKHRGVYPMCYPVIYYPTAEQARFTMIVHFPEVAAATYPLGPYPFPYVRQRLGIVECLIRRVRPANVNVVFSYGTLPPCD